MQRITLFGIVALASCSSEADVFIVDDPDALAKSAILRLDGDDQRLERDGNRFEARHEVRRDADGRIRVFYADGRMVDCPIGYVTPGAPQHLSYRLTPKGCEPL